ncbi:MAG: hypothetical protein DMG21_02015 [Acidobacteria bacterium]|nr:MAG: hypothetical protein DMG21_02015 [Acidobacteriota bacterium]
MTTATRTTTQCFKSGCPSPCLRAPASNSKSAFATSSRRLSSAPAPRWWHNAWNCHQFHSTSEFFADFGTYLVKVTVPQSYILGATGDTVSTETNSDGTKTVAFQGVDIHDFSWTASPDFQLIEDSWQGSAGAVKIRLLMSPGHLRQAGRYLQSVKGTLAMFDRWYGPYPYDRITVVDLPNGAGNAGGMEYPTLITGGTTWWEPRGIRGVELVTEHEFGHQYWYGMVGSNEFEESWLDEGFNTYSTGKVMDVAYGPIGVPVTLLGLRAGGLFDLSRTGKPPQSC